MTPDSGRAPHIKSAVREIENLWIELADGTRLAARAWLPDDAGRKPVPALLEYLPYRKRDGTYVRDALTHPYFAARGYACLRVDMRGSGESDGIMEDEYTAQEQADAVEVIAWIAKQSWCTGKVGMFGISWGGFNALQVAALQPPALKAIVSLCSTDDRYADDIHYKGGSLLAENLGWSSTMFCYSSRPPDPALVGERWRDLWLERLQILPNLVETWLEHPTRDAYWQHGSVCEDYGAITAATQLWGGWSDAYHNAVPRMLANMKAPRQGIIGPWLHKYPHFAVPGPAVGFLQEALRWWDRYLKGEDTGVEQDPMLRAFIEDYDRPAAKYDLRSGRWVGEAKWPSPAIQAEPVYLTATGIAGEPGTEIPLSLASPLDTGTAGGEYCQIWLGAEGPLDQRRDDAGSLCFDSAPLTETFEILGAPVVELELASDRPVAQLAARLNEVGPDGASLRVSYGILNLCHRESHAEPSKLEPGRRYRVRLQLDDCGHRFAAGNRVRLALSTAYWPMVWPTPEAATLTVYAGSAQLILPVRSGGGEVSLPPAEAAPPAERAVLRQPSNARHLVHDVGKGEVRVETFDDFGAAQIAPHALENGMIARETWSLRPEEPLSAAGQTHWTMTMGRGDWRVRTETRARLTGDATHFHVEGSLEAYEGQVPNERLVLRRQFKKSLRRGFI